MKDEDCRGCSERPKKSRILEFYDSAGSVGSARGIGHNLDSYPKLRALVSA